MQTAETIHPDQALILSKAVTRAAKAFGLTQSELGRILGRDRSSIARGIDPESKPGELALMLVRCYRALSVLVGQDAKSLKHWFTTPNLHTGGVPKEQVLSVQGLVRVTEYLDAMRAKL